MSLAGWWIALAAVLGFLAGIAVVLVALAVIRQMRTLPMDGRTWTGPLPRDLDDEEDETDEFLRDLNRQGHNG